MKRAQLIIAVLLAGCESRVLESRGPKKQIIGRVRVKPEPRILKDLHVGDSAYTYLLPDRDGSVWICPNWPENIPDGNLRGQRITRKVDGWSAEVDEEFMKKEHEIKKHKCFNPQQVELLVGPNTTEKAPE